MEKRLYRDPRAGALSGVCAGLADYYNTDKAWIRLIFICSVVFSPFLHLGLLGPVLYIALWIVIPVRPYWPDVDYRVDGSMESTTSVDKESSPDGRVILGWILLIIGVLFLLFQLDVIHWSVLRHYWPVILIVAGAATIISSFRKDHNENKTSHLGSDSSDRGSDSTS